MGTRIEEKGENLVLTDIALFVANSASGNCCTHVWGVLSTYGLRKFSITLLVTSVWPSVCGWKAVLNRRSVPNCVNSSSQNLLRNLGSRSEMITSGRPCNLKTWSMNNRAYFSAEIFLVQGTKWTILVNQSTNTAIAIIPSDSGKSVTRSVMICCHFRSGNGIGCSKPTFFRWSDFINWHTG